MSENVKIINNTVDPIESSQQYAIISCEIEILKKLAFLDWESVIFDTDYEYFYNEFCKTKSSLKEAFDKMTNEGIFIKEVKGEHIIYRLKNGSTDKKLLRESFRKYINGINSGVSKNNSVAVVRI